MAAENKQVQTDYTTETNFCATVLFITDRLVLPDTIMKRMATRKWTHASISPADFFSTEIETLACSVILLDAGDIHTIHWNILESKLKQLDQRTIPVILLNWPLSLEFSSYRMAFKMHSANYEELWARIESIIRFSSILAEQPSNLLQRKNIEEQLKIAGMVQRNFLPETLPVTDKLRFASLFHPAEWVSGDIYDAVRLDEYHYAFYITDAVGHSLPAALLTMYLKHTTLLRHTENDRYTIFRPAQVLGNLNSKMVAQKLKSCLFATSCCCLYNTQTGKLSFARAGHPYPVLIRPGCQPQPLLSRGGLLGIFDSMVFEEATIDLFSGDKIILYSDGIESLFGEVNDSGIFEFSEIFLKISALPLMSMLQQMEDSVLGWKKTSAETDDITVLGMEIL